MTNNIYCKAPWVSVSYMPGGKFAPCCQWRGEYFDSQAEMTQVVGDQFLQNQVPTECSTCPANAPGWRNVFDEFETDYKTSSVQFLDFRNNNMCNLKCRSCGPSFSTSWASEADNSVIHLFDRTNIDDIDLSNCKKIYFAGGEPLLNPQHYELLEKLIKQNLNPQLMYSTNMTVTGYKDLAVKDYWPHFEHINIHASIDAVGPATAVVRSGSDWETVEQTLNWIRSLPNTQLRLATVISAINIWWIADLFEYFKWIKHNEFRPVLAHVTGREGLGLINRKYRNPLINSLKISKFRDHPIIVDSIRALETVDNSVKWDKFLASQLILDNYRNEKWFDLLPIKQQVYDDLIHNGKTQHTE